MRNVIQRHLTYANVMATIAVFIAVGGSAFAASYVITSSSQIKDGAITSSDVKNSSLTGSDIKDSGLTNSDVKNSSLTGSDIKDKSLTPADFNGSVQGPAGPQGAQGPQGVPGAAGATKLTVRSSGPQMGDATARCLQGEVATGGGGYSSDGLLAVSYPFPLGESPTEWRAEAYQTDGGTPAQIAAWVVCAKP